MIKVKRALISVSDKKGLGPFVKKLNAMGVEILSTGGTAKAIRQAGVPVIDVSDYTGFPEMMNGRVKTLHPKIHAGLLAVRDDEDHMNQMSAHDMGLIDMVVVNLYPFESTVQKKNVSMDEAIENVDIGGPSMLRSAAKNYKSVAVICNPEKYSDIMKELETNSGLLSDSVLFKLAVEAFNHTAHYDGAISAFFNERLRGHEEFSGMDRSMSMRYSKIQDLRYGENPHQKAAFYKDLDQKNGLTGMKQRHGKELSFNNILDLNAAIEFIKDFKDPAAVVIKHNNPTGVAQAKTLEQAYKAAHACDPLSAFGGIIGLNQTVDEATAKRIAKSGFMECVIAPKFNREAMAVLKQKKNLRLIELNLKKLNSQGADIKAVYGGLLVQDKDQPILKEKNLKVVSRKKPTSAQIEAMMFGWKMIRNVKSNAIVLVKGQKAVGIGCGQTSRVESVNIAISKAGKEAKGSILISDAFLPHIDNVQIAAKAGIKAIIQTGGSIADKAVIAEADKNGMVMVFSGVRHFKH